MVEDEEQGPPCPIFPIVFPDAPSSRQDRHEAVFQIEGQRAEAEPLDPWFTLGPTAPS